jgi:hypothetical protein
MSQPRLVHYAGVGATLVAATPLAGDDAPLPGAGDRNRTWLAGDHHVHSEYSGGYDDTVSPPRFIKGGDAVYPIAMNAMMARYFGLSWAVCTDHGGPNHSKVSLEQAYPDLLRSRSLVPEVLQFWGMEFDAPAMDHHTLMLPRHDGEAQQLFELESRFDKLDAAPADADRDTEAKMIEFLESANAMPERPLVIAHHAARSATGPGVYGLDTPRQLRANNNVAPEVYVGFEGAPGHQAGPLVGGRRGAYGDHPTYGGYDQMTARVGGLWDSLLGEGRRWWITATSDSHVHWTRGGSDFWPGEYSKTYVLARPDYGDIVDGLRAGRIWVTTGDLISELDLSVRSGNRAAAMGQTLTLGRDDSGSVEVGIRFRPLQGTNANGDRPTVRRVDLIVGRITGPGADLTSDTNATARVVARFGPGDWARRGFAHVIRHRLGDVEGDLYLRVRGTNTDEAEPLPDGTENPWTDLWFYSNPVFVRASAKTSPRGEDETERHRDRGADA